MKFKIRQRRGAGSQDAADLRGTGSDGDLLLSSVTLRLPARMAATRVSSPCDNSPSLTLMIYIPLGKYVNLQYKCVLETFVYTVFEPEFSRMCVSLRVS